MRCSILHWVLLLTAHITPLEAQEVRSTVTIRPAIHAIAVPEPYSYSPHANSPIIEGDDSQILGHPATARPVNLDAGAYDLSPTLALLREQIAEFGTVALERFWTTMEIRGAPLVEAGSRHDNNRVTFIQRNAHAADRFRLEGGLTVLLAETVMDHTSDLGEFSTLDDTDVAFLTLEVPNDLRAPYAIRRKAAGDDEWERILDRWNTATFAPGTQWARSVLALHRAPALPWDTVAPLGSWTEFSVNSTALGGMRQLSVFLPHDYDPDRAEAYPVLIGMDAFAFRAPLMGADRVLTDLTRRGLIPPMVMVLTEDIAAIGDHRGYEPVVQFLVDEVLAGARQRFNISDRPEDVMITGTSRRGMVAAFAGWRRPESIGNVVSLSGSFYWKPPNEIEFEWLPRLVASSKAPKVRFHLSAGLLETFVSPRNAGHYLLGTNRHMRDVLQAKGYDFAYHEFNGVHSEVNWVVEFARGLTWIWEG